MKTRAFLRLGLLLTFSAAFPLSAKDEARVSYPSKVSSAKGKEREKLFSPWMSTNEFDRHTEEMSKQGKQILYFEYDAARVRWRSIHSSTVRFDSGFSYWTLLSESEAEAKLNAELQAGRQPAFFCRDGSTYTMLFVHPDHLAAARKELDVLGIGEPKVRK